MTKKLFQIFLLSCVAMHLVVIAFSQDTLSTTKNSEQYTCLPCGYDCDKDSYSEPGKCTHCQMSLVKRSTVNFKSISPSELCRYLKDHPNTVLLDVRTKEEFEGKSNPNYGAFKNAINIPVQELENRLSSISSLKNKEIIVYCSQSH